MLLLDGWVRDGLSARTPRPVAARALAELSVRGALLDDPSEREESTMTPGTTGTASIHRADAQRSDERAFGPPASGSLHEALELLERAIGYTRVQLQQVSPPMLARVTPCVDWTLSDLLDHMAGGLDALTAAADLDGALGRYARVALAPSPVRAVDRLRERACSMLGAWAAIAHDDLDCDDRVRSSALLASAGALEVAVHGWDVSQTTGACEPVPAALARDLVPWVDVVVSEIDRPARFDHPVAGPAVGPSSRLLQLLGREP
jgi:uncharacterized protein (TIGR03086 family)